MYTESMRLITLGLFVLGFLISQEGLPRDRHWDSAYHPYPDYRESEGHPLRLVSYILYPVGWVLREGVTRPLSYLTSRTNISRSVFGYRYEADYAYSSCFGQVTNLNCSELAPYKNLRQTMQQQGGSR